MSSQKEPFRLLLAILSTLLLAGCMTVGGSLRDQEQVVRVDQQRRTALLTGDPVALDHVIADDATLFYGDGTTDTKASLIAAIRAGVRWTKYEYRPTRIRFFGGVAILTGVAVTSVDSGPEHRILVTSVNARKAGKWQLVANQATRDSGAQ